METSCSSPLSAQAVPAPAFWRKTRIAQSRGEEFANAASHAAGVLGALVAAPFLIVHAARLGEPGYLVGVCLFAAAVLLLYAASTIYHLLPLGRAKRLFWVFDHAAIFLLIAGTYTPFTLGVLSGAWGWTLFGLVWGIAAVGIGLKVFARFSHPWLSTGLYLAMGWLVVIALGPLIERVPVAGLAWLVAGGLAYTAGVAFFVLDGRVRFAHFVWHLFVLAGTACHYVAVGWYAA